MNEDNKDSIAYFAFEKIRSAISKEAEADVAPVVHAHWTGNAYGTVFKASCCGAASNSWSKYCPNCGAKMDGMDGEENDEIY